MMEKGESWKRQRILKKQDIPIQEEVLQMARSYSNIMERSLFIMAYLTGGRITEIIKCPYLRKFHYMKEKDAKGNFQVEKVEKVRLDYPGILKKNIMFTQLRGKNVMIISMQNRKNKNIQRKNVPVPVEKEGEFINLLQEYLVTLKDDDPLFPFQTGKSKKIMAKIGMNAHFLRDIRLTHMVTIYHFDTFQLVKFAGWTNISPAERYVRLGMTDLVDKY